MRMPRIVKNCFEAEANEVVFTTRYSW